MQHTMSQIYKLKKILFTFDIESEFDVGFASFVFDVTNVCSAVFGFVILRKTKTT